MENEELIKAVKQHRVDLDAVLQQMKPTAQAIFKLHKGGREVELSVTNLQQSIMWLGMVLKAIAPELNPYPNSYKPENAIVDPTADGLKL